jgi:hypothetical protein
MHYQQSDDAESFLWIILWIALKISPIPSSKPYPSVNNPDTLRVFKQEAVVGHQPEGGSFQAPIKQMFKGLVSDVGNDLNLLCLVHVQKRLDEFEHDVMEKYHVFE